MFVVIVGDPINGLSLFGPFETAEAANEWAEFEKDTWWVVAVEPPQ